MKNPSKKLLSYLSNAETQFIDSLYQQYIVDPDSIDAEWRRFFEGMDFAAEYSSEGTSSASLSQETPANHSILKELKVRAAMDFFRHEGHLYADLDPLKSKGEIEKNLKSILQSLDLTFDDSDFASNFSALSDLGPDVTSLSQGLTKLQKIYCSTIAIETEHIQDLVCYDWIKNYVENDLQQIVFTKEEKVQMLKNVGQAVLLEQFIHTKYTGQKRFSLEGGESVMAALDYLISYSSHFGVEQMVIGMAHRGRINMLVNLFGKDPAEIFGEFEGKKALDKKSGDGDVKYHLGYITERKLASGKSMKLRMLNNPSHLEAVTPLVQGLTMALQEESDVNSTIPLQIHGDGAVAGQGVVYEVVQMSELAGYKVGGSIHIVINNQIGFTTQSDCARSSRYATGVAKTIESPIVHVNGDDIEAVVKAVKFAIDFRQKFNKDIFIDIICYRKYGHNEGDEPRFTSPKMYQTIDRHQTPLDLYKAELLRTSIMTAEAANALEEEFKTKLQDAIKRVKESTSITPKKIYPTKWEKIRVSRPEDFENSVVTKVNLKSLEAVLKSLTYIPDKIKPISKSVKLVEGREKQFRDNKIDWGLAELLSYGSLLLEGHNIRLSGQDCIRGTFSHRHSSIYDQSSNEPYCQLNFIQEKQGKINVINSLLAEYAVLGFEYGHSLNNPNNLTMWEAQFGDFSNTAQVIIDQYISAAESKWQQMSGLVLLLPHGYEGQGPEHSSARMERYLQLCAEFNMIVANCTTPANLFHILRRQLKNEFRKPLVLFTPKSLLRHPHCISSVKDLTEGNFKEIIDDASIQNKKEVKRVLLCSGKIFYDLLEQQEKDKRKDVAIVRLEQLHPLPLLRLDQLIKSYSKAEFIWIQDEPKNMGQWNYIQRKINQVPIQVISRKSSASPATGYLSVHKEEQAELVAWAFDLNYKGSI